MNWIVVFVNCEKPLNSGMHVDISSCFKNGVYSSNSSLSHSKRYRFVLIDDYATRDLEDYCQVEQISLSSWPERYGTDPFRNSSCTDIRNKLLFGFELLCNKFIVEKAAEMAIAASMRRTILLLAMQKVRKRIHGRKNTYN
jgi:hypothetical protein